MKTLPARYKTIFENTGTGTILIEEDMTISMVNTQLARMAGIEKSRIEGKMKFPELLVDADREKVMANHRLRRRHPDLAPRNYPCRVIDGTGAIRECILTVAMIAGGSQSVASITDISRQKQLERQIAGISENERRQMGQALHDDLGSHLAGVEAMCSLLSGRLERQGHSDAQLAQEIRELINQAIAKTRAMVRGLLAVDLADTGFMEALGRCARDVEKAFGLTCRVVFHAAPDTGSGNVEVLTHLYYIVREAVNNAARHGKANDIEIRVTEQGPDLVISVIDSGCGMTEDDSARGKGSGLLIMQHRADLIGAELSIGENTSGGIIVRCRIEKKYLS